MCTQWPRLCLKLRMNISRGDHRWVPTQGRGFEVFLCTFLYFPNSLYMHNYFYQKNIKNLYLLWNLY